jgi:hypothetical protein
VTARATFKQDDGVELLSDTGLSWCLTHRRLTVGCKACEAYVITRRQSSDQRAKISKNIRAEPGFWEAMGE